MKKLLLNMKTGMEYEDIETYVTNTKTYAKNFIIFPSSIYITRFVESGFNVGIQNISTSDAKNQTGEITALQAKSCSVKTVIIGHSERRTNQKEDYKILVKKMENAINNDLDIVFCIGENLVDYKLKETNNVVYKQLDEVFSNINYKDIKNLYIAYEPIWAIGSGITPSNFEISKVSAVIKDYLKDKGINADILYGGSVSDNNIDNLIEIDNIDGFLVGNASNSYEKVIKMCEKIMNSTK